MADSELQQANALFSRQESLLKADLIRIIEMVKAANEQLLRSDAEATQNISRGLGASVEVGGTKKRRTKLNKSRKH
jgi:hypothetical protein